MYYQALMHLLELISIHHRFKSTNHPRLDHLELFDSRSRRQHLAHFFGWGTQDERNHFEHATQIIRGHQPVDESALEAIDRSCIRLCATHSDILTRMFHC